MGSRRVGLKRERGLERRRKGRVKVHNDGRMSAQQEITVEGLLSAQGPFHPLLSFSLHMKTKKIKLARGSVSKNSRNIPRFHLVVNIMTQLDVREKNSEIKPALKEIQPILTHIQVMYGSERFSDSQLYEINYWLCQFKVNNRLDSLVDNRFFKIKKCAFIYNRLSNWINNFERVQFASHMERGKYSLLVHEEDDSNYCLSNMVSRRNVPLAVYYRLFLSRV